MANPPADAARTSAASERHIEELYRTLRTAIRFGCGSVIAYLASQAAIAMAGQTTSVVVHAGLSFFADLRFVLSFALAGAAGTWAIFERGLRQRVTEPLHGRIRELEAAIDPHRSSSKLTSKGKTNPMDRMN